MPLQDDALSFVVDNAPECVVVYDSSHKLIYLNPPARKFLDRQLLPEEVPSLIKRLFKYFNGDGRGVAGTTTYSDVSWILSGNEPPTSSVPEPSTMLLLGSGLLGLVGLNRRRKA